jgi:hypothetical protein
MIQPRCLSHGEVRPPLFQGGFVSHGKWFRGPCVHPDEERRGYLAELDNATASKIENNRKSRPQLTEGTSRTRSHGYAWYICRYGCWSEFIKDERPQLGCQS